MAVVHELCVHAMNTKNSWQMREKCGIRVRFSIKVKHYWSKKDRMLVICFSDNRLVLLNQSRNKAWTKIKSFVNAYYRTQCHWRILLAKPLYVVREIAIGCPVVSCGFQTYRLLRASSQQVEQPQGTHYPSKWHHLLQKTFGKRKEHKDGPFHGLIRWSLANMIWSVSPTGMKQVWISCLTSTYLVLSSSTL